MPKTALTLNNFSGGYNSVKDDRDIAINELADIDGFMVDMQGAIRTVGGLATHGSIEDQAGAYTAKAKGGYGIAVLESDYETEPKTIESNSDLDIYNADYLKKVVNISSITGATATITTDVDHKFYTGESIEITGTVDYNGVYVIQTVPSSATFTIIHANSGDTGAVGLIWYLWTSERSNKRVIIVGDEIKISGTTNNNGFYTVELIDDGNKRLFVTGDFIEEYNVSATITVLTKNETLLLSSDAPNGKIDTYSSNNDLWTVNQIDIDSTGGYMPNYAKAIYHSADGAVRVCDAEFSNASNIRWFGLIKRTHFYGTKAAPCTAAKEYYDWYDKDNKLSPPTYGVEHATDYPTANLGFNFTATMATDANSNWLAATYEIAFSFIYDGNQESLLYIPSDTFVVAEGEKVSIIVRAQTSGTGYNERISGGRIYARVSGSDDAWFLLCDIDMFSGARTTLNSKFTAWATVSTTTTSTGSIDSLGQNLDTYESLNGYSHKDYKNSLGESGEGYKASVVSNRRAFIANVRRMDEATQGLKTYADRIYYSQPGLFDTFPMNNFIDVVIGDSESYTALTAYADRLLAFKDFTLQIINIASPSDVGWFKESEHKFMGVKQPSAITDTEFGPCWVNDAGCYFYNGQSSPVNLIGDKLHGIEDKIDTEEWTTFVQDTSIIGYIREKKQLLIMKDCTGTLATSGDCYLYDFATKSWVKLSNTFTDSKVYTNFVQDWNGDLVVGYFDGTATIAYKKWSDTSITRTGLTLTTKDIDFGDLLHMKKIYKIYITYKSDGAETTPIKYFTNGGGLTGQTPTNLVGDLADTAGVSVDLWDVLVAYPATPFTCQSLQLVITIPTTALISINDITIEYRTLYARVS